jgi:hypothetical protein
MNRGSTPDIPSNDTTDGTNIAMAIFASDGSVWDSRQAVDRLMRDTSFVTRFASTRAVTLDQDPLLNSCLKADSAVRWRRGGLCRRAGLGGWWHGHQAWPNTQLPGETVKVWGWFEGRQRASKAERERRSTLLDPNS